MSLVQFDNLSDRRDLFRLLERLDGKEGESAGNLRRRMLLESIAGTLKPPAVLRGETGTVHATYWRLGVLAAQFNLDLERVAMDLEAYVRKKGW